MLNWLYLKCLGGFVLYFCLLFVPLPLWDVFFSLLYFSGDSLARLRRACANFAKRQLAPILSPRLCQFSASFPTSHRFFANFRAQNLQYGGASRPCRRASRRQSVQNSPHSPICATLCLVDLSGNVERLRHLQLQHMQLFQHKPSFYLEYALLNMSVGIRLEPVASTLVMPFLVGLRFPGQLALADNRCFRSLVCIHALGLRRVPALHHSHQFH
jgi:hypothetical protein